MKFLRTLQNALKKFMLYKIEGGSYKFFVQKLEAEVDIDLAASIYSTDYFRHNLMPLPVDTGSLRKIIVFAPHQDDEAIGCGGLMTHLSAQGCDIHIVVLTDGENKSGKMHRIRQQEAQKLADQLPATLHEIGISNVDLNVSENQLDKISQIINNVAPDAVFSIWPLDLPPIHRLCNVVVSHSLQRSNLDLKILPIFSYQVHTALLPNVYYDYTNIYQQKQALIGIYKSQLQDQNYQHLSAGLDAWNTRFLPWSPDKRYVELFTQLPAVAYIEMIDCFYSKNISQTFKGNQGCIDSYHDMENLR